MELPRADMLHIKKKLLLLACITLPAFCIAQSAGEKRVLNKIRNIPEVRDRAKYIERHSNGKRHLQYIISSKPTREHNYYSVKVLEDNGEMYYPRFNFRVAPKTFSVTYLDQSIDSVIDYKAWKKMQKD